MKRAIIILGLVFLIISSLASAVNISEEIVEINFIDPDNVSFHELETSKNRLKAEIEVKDLSFFQKLSYVANNIWVNYVWIKE